MVLVGVPALERALASDEVLARRADVKVRIAPLDLDAATAYLNHRIQRARGTLEIFEAGAISALRELGDGLPGLMNTLADNSLFEAFLCGRSRVSQIDVERVHRDLGWGASPTVANGSQPGGTNSEGGAVVKAATLTEKAETPPPADVTAPMGGVVVPEHVSDFLPDDGPPKEQEDEIEDLLVELVEE